MPPPAEQPRFRPTWATIDLDALVHNAGLIEERLAACLPQRTPGTGMGLMAMVKADAYGHGAVPVSRALERCGVAALGVATVEEGVELRDAGVTAPILVMGGMMGVGAPASERLVEAHLTPVVHSADVLPALDASAARAGRTLPVHVKIDTGMSRLGVRPESLAPLLTALQGCAHLAVEGVMTHLADAGEEEPTAAQAERFAGCREEVERALGAVPIWHMANSMALLRGAAVDIPWARTVWARPGLALYGEIDGTAFPNGELRPVMGLESRVALLKRVPAGTAVSYAGTFVVERASRLAIVPIGYADGYPWRASGRASVIVRGRRVPVVGRVTMDMIVVDVTDLPQVAVGDRVVLLGRAGDAAITLEEFASWSGTITYEALCRISKRMPRIYTGEH